MIRRHFLKFFGLTGLGLLPVAPQRPAVATRAGVLPVTIPAGRISQPGTIHFAFPEPPAVVVTALVDADAAGYSPDELVGLPMPSVVLTAVSGRHADVIVTRLNPADASSAQTVQVHWQATARLNEVSDG